MSRQGAGTSVPVPLAYPAACWDVLLCVPCWAALLCVPVGGGPPARRPRCELRSARRLEAWPGSAAAHRHRGRSLRHPSHRRRCVAGVWLGASAPSPARPRHCPLISHVIPLRLVQSLNLHRWNCNVFGVSRKMTTINYVRNLGGGAAGSLIGGWARRLEAWPGPVPQSVPYPQFRMQFPNTCSSSLSEKPGISTITFQSMKCTRGNCMRICADRAPPPPTSTAAWSLYSLWA